MPEVIVDNQEILDLAQDLSLRCDGHMVPVVLVALSDMLCCAAQTMDMPFEDVLSEFVGLAMQRHPHGHDHAAVH